MTFVTFASLRLSGVIGEVVLDTSEEVLGNFDIEIEKKHSGSLSVNLYDPEIIAVVNREIAKLGGSRAINMMLATQVTSDNGIIRVTGTVVK